MFKSAFIKQMMVLSFSYLYISYYNLGGLAGLMIMIISVVTLMPFLLRIQLSQ